MNCPPINTGLCGEVAVYIREQVILGLLFYNALDLDIAVKDLEKTNLTGMLYGLVELISKRRTH